MILALTVWKDRIAPVFDVAGNLMVLKIVDGKVESRKFFELPDAFVSGKIMSLSEMGVDTVICGALSQQAAWLLNSYNIKFFSFISGDLEQIIQSYLEGDFNAECYAMPGCRRQGGRGRNRRGRGRFGQRWNMNY